MPVQGIMEHEDGLSKLLSILATSGMLKEFQDITDSIGNIGIGSAYGEDAGTMTFSILKGVVTGTVAAMALSFAPLELVLLALFSGALGTINGLAKNYEKKNDAFRSWYGGLYEQSLADSEQRLSTGVAMAGVAEQERLLAAGESGTGIKKRSASLKGRQKKRWSKMYGIRLNYRNRYGF